MMDSLLGQRYEVRQEIGRGGYGQVCKGYDHEKEMKVAIKLEKVDDLEGEVSYLKREEEVYSKLKGEESFGIANIHQFGADLIHDDCDDDSDDSLDDNDYKLHYMVMDLLGPDLEELLTECSEQFSLKTVLLLADQMIRIIQYVHSKDYIHGDIKPRNFVLGRGKKGSNMIYMVDFGLAQRYRDSQTKEHIAYSVTASYAGTTMFTSLNCHQCKQKSRRDDLESLGYVLVYFLCGSLPWQDIKDWNDKSEKRRLVYEKKASISIEELCTSLPCEFVKYMEYCRSLQFYQEPDYDYLRKQFQDLYDKAGFTDVVEYDWTLRQRKAINYSDIYEKSTEKYYLKSNINSSDVHAEDVFFYFNLTYKPIEEPELNLQTIEECLEHVLKFVTSEHQFNSENDFKWNNKSMNDIVEHYIKTNEDIAWIYEWDNLDWKTATKEEVIEKRLLFAELADQTLEPGLFFMKCAYDVHHNRYSSNKNRNQAGKSEGVKRFFDSVTILTSPQLYMRNGSCEENLQMFISKDKITDASQFLESRNLKVTVKPDGVFTKPTKSDSKFLMFVPRWEMVLEIYGPNADELLTTLKDEKEYLISCPSASCPDKDSVHWPDPLKKDSKSVMDTPAINSPTLEAESIPPSSTSDKGITILNRKPDIIADQSYRNCIREYIKKSLPSSCRDHLHTVQNMAGQHVLQLLAQFKRRHVTEGEEMSSIEKSLGIFIVNEFVYFSRLDISSLAYRIIVGESKQLLISDLEKKSILKECPPEVSFSNFRLDLTKKNHRLALVLFLKVYLYPNASKGYGSKVKYLEFKKKLEKMLRKDNVD